MKSERTTGKSMILDTLRRISERPVNLAHCIRKFYQGVQISIRGLLRKQLQLLSEKFFVFIQGFFGHIYPPFLSSHHNIWNTTSDTLSTVIKMQIIVIVVAP
nr:MAG TPA: hypothetical protein [Caudoviricetes sp.]